MKRAHKSQRRVLMRDLMSEIRALREEIRNMRAATEHNSAWVAQAARGKDSAGNWR